MKNPALRVTGAWVPMTRSEAKRRGLVAESLRPTYRACDVVLVLDRSVWFEARIAPRWIVAFRLVSQRGQPVIAELRVFPDEPDAPRRAPGRWRGEYGAPAPIPPGGLNARDLRQIRTQAFHADLRTITANMMTVSEAQAATVPLGDVDSGWREALSSLFPGVPCSPVPPVNTSGRKGRTDLELSRIAAAYERAYLSGRPAIAAVAKAAGISLTKARDAVCRARARALLTAAVLQGKGGGILTPAARALLAQDVKIRTTKGGRTHGTKER